MVGLLEDDARSARGAGTGLSLRKARQEGSRPRTWHVRIKNPALPASRRAGSFFSIRSLEPDQLAVLIELLIGLMSGIVWIPEFVAS